MDDERTTRAGFVRCASGGVFGLGLFGGIGLDAVRLLASEEARGATLRSPNDVLRFDSRPDLRHVFVVAGSLRSPPASQAAPG